MTKLLFLYITAETQTHFIMISSLHHNYTFIILIMPKTVPEKERQRTQLKLQVWGEVTLHH